MKNYLHFLRRRVSPFSSTTASSLRSPFSSTTASSLRSPFSSTSASSLRSQFISLILSPASVRARVIVVRVPASRSRPRVRVIVVRVRVARGATYTTAKFSTIFISKYSHYNIYIDNIMERKIFNRF